MRGMRVLAKRFGWRPVKLHITKEQHEEALRMWAESVKAEEEFRRRTRVNVDRSRIINSG